MFPYLLDVVVAQSTSILQLLACEDQALLIRWDSLLVLDLRLDIVDRVARFDLERDGLSREGLDETIQICVSVLQVHVVCSSGGVDYERLRMVDESRKGETYICTRREEMSVFWQDTYAGIRLTFVGLCVDEFVILCRCDESGISVWLAK